MFSNEMMFFIALIIVFITYKNIQLYIEKEKYLNEITKELVHKGRKYDEGKRNVN